MPYHIHLAAMQQQLDEPRPRSLSRPYQSPHLGLSYSAKTKYDSLTSNVLTLSVCKHSLQFYLPQSAHYNPPPSHLQISPYWYLKMFLHPFWHLQSSAKLFASNTVAADPLIRPQAVKYEKIQGQIFQHLR